MTTATETKCRPIPFSGPMVRAILDGGKTQTRRVIVPQPRMDSHGLWGFDNHPDVAGFFAEHVFGACFRKLARCPYGQAGDRLWVRESFFIDDYRFVDGPLGSERPDVLDEAIYYRADGDCCEQIPECECASVGKPRWRTARFMPRWASRLTLELTSVRVQRVQDINWIDAACEGFQPGPGRHNVASPQTDADRMACLGEFRRTWDALNAKRGYGWDANPWVWALEFRPVK